MSDFTPNPLYAFGRIDTSAGEGGESLHKINPALFGVDGDGLIGRGSEVDGPATMEDISLVGSPVGSSPPPPEGLVVEPQDAVPGGTVDTGPPGAPVNEDGSSPEADGDADADAGAGDADGDGEVTDYEALLKPALIELADSRGIDSSGTRAEIIERLEADDAE